VASPFDKARVVNQGASNSPFSRARVIAPQKSQPTTQDVISGIDPAKNRREFGNEALGAFNTATFGIPRAVANKTAKLAYGESQPEVIGEGGKIGQLLGLFGAGGLVRGGIKKLAPRLMGRGVVKGAVRGAIEGGVTSQAIEPGGESAVVGATLGAVGEPLVAGGKNLYSATFGKSKFLKDTQKQFGSAIRRSKGKFGKFLKDARTNFPGRNVDFSQTVNDLRVSRTYNPEVDRLIESTPGLKRLVDSPQLATQVPVDEVQDYINIFSGKLPRSGASAGPQYRSRDLNVLRARDTMKENQAIAFPEIKPVRREYAQTRQVEKQVGPKLRDQSVEATLERGFPTLIEENLQKVLGKEGIKRLRGYKQATNLKNLVVNPVTAGGLGATGLGYLAMKKLMSQSNNSRSD
jgi:hypothetical protein